MAIWGAGMVPAALLMIWLGNVEATWLGLLTAWVILLALVGVYELLQTWVEGILRRRRARRAAGNEDART